MAEEEKGMKNKPLWGLVCGSIPSYEVLEQFQMLKEDYELRVFAPSWVVQVLQSNLFWEGLSCVPFPYYQENPEFFPGLEKALASCQVVILQERLGVYAYQTLKAKIQYRFKMILWVENAHPFPGEENPHLRAIREEVTQGADGIFVQSRGVQEALLAEQVSKDKILYLPLAVSRRRLGSIKAKREAREALGWHSLAHVLGYWGGLEWEEGLQDVLLGLKNLVSHHGERFRLALLGAGSYGNHLFQLAIKLKIDHLVYRVSPHREAYVNFLEAIDGVVFHTHPSKDWQDGDPSRFMVAMANGLPILAPRFSLAQEIVGKHRMDFCEGNFKSLSKAWKKMSEEKALVEDMVKKNEEKIKPSSDFAQNWQDFMKDLNPKPSHLHSKDYIRVWISEVEEKLKAKQYLPAMERIEQLLGENLPSHEQAHLYRLIGDAFARLGDPQSSQEAYLKAVDLDPYLSKAYLGLGTLALTKGQHEVALVHFQKSLELNPQDEMVFLGLALGYHGLDQLEQAQSWAKKCLEKSPDHQPAIYTMVRIAYELEQYKEAEKVLRRYLFLHPQDQDMQYALAGLLYTSQRIGEAMKILEEHMAMNPMDTRAQSLLKKCKKNLAKEEKKVDNIFFMEP